MRNVCFSSGPCAKRKEWTLPGYKLAGRSHRSEEGLKLIKDTIELQREVLRIPKDYLIGIISGSCTAAMELLLWNLLGERPVDVLSYCVFSNRWAFDVKNELKIENVTSIEAPFPEMADWSKVNFSHDLVFCLSSTTSGVSFRNTDWIPKKREGLTICDAASAAFIIDCDWSKLDAVAFSWQKGLGGEGGFGTIVLSPRAIQRLENFTPNRPTPRIFKIVSDGKINYDLFEGNTLNTPSLLCVREFYENLLWAKNSGGMPFLAEKVEENYKTVCDWLSRQNIFRFLVKEECRAHHIACLDINDEKYQKLSKDDQWKFLRKISKKASEKNYGYDFLGHTLTEPHIRIWCGPTIDASDLKFFLYKLSELYQEVAAENGDC